MRRQWYVMGFFLVLLALSERGAHAAFSVSISPRYWAASWDSSAFTVLTPAFSTTIIEGGVPKQYTFSPKLTKLKRIDIQGSGMYGGSLDFSFWRMGISAQYQTGTYDLKMTDELINPEDSNTLFDSFGRPVNFASSVLSAEAETTRTDIDFSVRYQVLQDSGNSLNVFIGYKYISYEYSDQDVIAQTKFVINGITSNLPAGQSTTLPGINPVYSGPAVGFSGIASLGRRFFSYGTATAIPYMMADLEDKDADDIGWAYNIDMGIGLAYPEAKLYPTLSYRFQQFGGFDELRDTFQGFALDLRVRFP